MFKNYNMNQVILPMDVEVKLQENDIAYAVHELVESIPDEAFSEFLRDTGCPAYHPRMMMKVDECTQKIEESDNVSERKQMRSQRKEPKQAHKQFKDFVARKQKYERDMEIFEERNSYSKTDHDATFMRMKDDYMKNGQLKAGYNIQIATEGQYALAYDIFPNPTDMRTFRPFLDRIEQDFFELPPYIVADAGYGSEENYEDVSEIRNREALITYNSYRKEKKKSFRKNEFHSANWAYNEEEDAFTCPNGKRLSFRYRSQKADRNGYQREFKVYECEDCTGCPLRSACTKAKEGNNRKIYYNEKWEHQKNKVKEKLSNEKTGEIYGKRKVDVEPVFGFLKANLRFTRMSVRGKECVGNELGFAFLAVNLRKYTARNENHPTHNETPTTKKSSDHQNSMIGTLFYCFRLVMSQPLFNWPESYKVHLLGMKRSLHRHPNSFGFLELCFEYTFFSKNETFLILLPYVI